MELVGALALAIITVPGPSGIELERLIDSSYNPPAVNGAFLIEGLVPVPCEDSVLFHGSSFDDDRLGLYSASSAGVEVVANAGTPVPGSGSTFQEAWLETCAGGRTMFLGDDDITPLSTGRSVFEWVDGNVNRFLDVGVRVGNSEVQSFDRITGNKFGVAMIARLGLPVIMDALVIQWFDGDPFIAADEATVLPGQTEPVTVFSRPLLVGRDLVFRARTNLTLGLYRWKEGQGISLIADTQTPVPIPGTGNFGTFGGIVNLDYGVVFEAGYSEGLGLFMSRAGRLEPLILPGQLTEDGETFTSMFDPSGTGSLLSFSGRTAENSRDAIFVLTGDGSVKRILGIGDMIEGQTVAVVLNAGADRTSVAIRVNRRFTPDDPTQEVIYRATFPEPNVIPTLPRAGLLALAVALVVIGLHGLRRRHGR